MREKIKEFGNYALGLVIFLGIIALTAVFIRGSVWAAAHLLSPLILIGWIVIAIDFLILLPLSIFRKLRSFTGSLIFISSFVFGLVTWLLGFIITYDLWGIWAVVIGILFFGGGVVPLAMLAMIIKALWVPFFALAVLVVLTIGARFAGLLIALSTAAEESSKGFTESNKELEDGETEG